MPLTTEELRMDSQSSADIAHNNQQLIGNNNCEFSNRIAIHEQPETTESIEGVSLRSDHPLAISSSEQHSCTIDIDEDEEDNRDSAAMPLNPEPTRSDPPPTCARIVSNEEPVSLNKSNLRKELIREHHFKLLKLGTQVSATIVALVIAIFIFL